MRVVGILIFALGLGAIAAAVTLAWVDFTDIRERRAAIPKQEAELQQTRDGLYETELLYRGLRKSIPALSDSMRTARAGDISKELNVYSKKVAKFKIDEKEQKRLLARNRTKIKERKKAIYRKSAPLAGAALLFLGLGAFAFRRAS